jgi:hypothetical protein
MEFVVQGKPVIMKKIRAMEYHRLVVGDECPGSAGSVETYRCFASSYVLYHEMHSP